jgi:hypothetical protein
LSQKFLQICIFFFCVLLPCSTICQQSKKECVFCGAPGIEYWVWGLFFCCYLLFRSIGIMCVGRLRPAHYWIDRQLLWHLVKVAEAMTSLIYTKRNLTSLADPGCLCFWVVVLVALDSIHEATEKAAEPEWVGRSWVRWKKSHWVKREWMGKKKGRFRANEW